MKAIIAALVAVLLLGAALAPTGATVTPEVQCAPPTILVDQEVEVGIEYEHKHFLYAINKNVQWFGEVKGFPWNFTGDTRSITETQQVEVPNPDYDPDCGKAPEPEYVTVAWLLPIDFEAWDGLGRPTGDGAGGAIWPQTYATHAGTGTTADLDALDGMSMAACAVYQVDTYPESAGLHERAGLDWGDDHGAVIAWKFLFDEDCEPVVEVTPTPEATPEVTPRGPETEYEPTPVYDVTICYEGVEYQVTAEQATEAFEEGAEPGRCAVASSTSTPPAPTDVEVLTEAVAPAPASTGMLGPIAATSATWPMLAGLVLTVGTLAAARALAYRKK